MIDLLRTGEFADLVVNFDPTLRSIRLHRSILHARTRPLLEFITEHPNKVSEFLAYDEFQFVVEFIYSGRFEVALLDRLIESRKLQQAYDHEWMLVPNRLIRFAVRFCIPELDQLILEHLVEFYLDLETLATILMDACRNDPSRQLVTKLDAVEMVCFKFIRNNLGSAIKSGCFNSLSKEILLGVIQNCII